MARVAKEANKDATPRLEKSLAECKTSVDRMKKELGTVEVLKKSLLSKPWDATQMVEFLAVETDNQQVAADKMNSVWADAKLKIKSTTVEEKLEVAAQLESTMKETNTSYTRYAKETLTEYSKFK